MKNSATAPAPVTPALCPACRSASIVTTAKTPDADSYWRCTSCGEILECVEVAAATVRPAEMAVKQKRLVRDLLELIAALDRRVPRMERAGETSIARDAAALKARALERIAELERETPRWRNQSKDSSGGFL